MRFEACFDPGEDNERMWGWEVVEWTTINEKGKIGHKIASFYGKGAEEDAKRLAAEKQAWYEEEMENLANEQWQRDQDERDEYDFA